jgi:hypothetical protein
MPRSKQKEVRKNYPLRLSTLERQIMQTKADEANLKLSEYLRVAGLNTVIRSPTKIPELNRATYIELGQIGNNINQIAKTLYSFLHRGIECNLSSTGLQKELQALNSQLQEIRLEIVGIAKTSNDDCQTNQR